MRFITLVLLALLAVSQAQASKPDYAIIIDAGSSGSRLHLFQYQTDTVIPVIDDIFSEKTTPGLSSFEQNPEAAPASLKKLLDDAAAELKKRHIPIRRVNISIMGTAGMRLLSDQAQQAIYNQVSGYIKTHYAFNPKTIATISGKMEGIYGWLDINYLAKNFNAKEDITVGSIDMGGASTQIAFSTKDDSKPNDEISLEIGGQTYTVFSASFIGLGQDLARNDVNKNAFSSSCYPINYPLTETVKGNFNLSTCKTIYLDLINLHNIKNRLISLSSQKTFIAYSGIYSTYHFLETETTPSHTAVEMRIQAVCTQSWDQLKQHYPSVPEKYLSNYCANASYQTDLLYDVYQLQDSQITVSNKINGNEIDWTLGAALFSLINGNSI